MHSIRVAIMVLALPTAVLGQAPLTPGVGQYCSNYFSVFDPARVYAIDGGIGWIVAEVDYYSSIPRWNDFSGTSGPLYSNICFDQPGSYKVCPWALGQNCYSIMWFFYCYEEDYCIRRNSYQTSMECLPGCSAVSACTLPANARAISAANPTTSPSGCSYTCNSGYVAQGSSCVSTQTTTTAPSTTSVASCQPGYYLSGGSCQPCTLCPTGQYKAQCSGSSPGVCVNCNNTV